MVADKKLPYKDKASAELILSLQLISAWHMLKAFEVRSESALGHF